MTHDELLAKIDAEGEFLVQHFDCEPVFISALYAVVALHEPRHYLIDDNEGGNLEGYICKKCCDEEEEQYPCQTIKVIEAALNA